MSARLMLVPTPITRATQVARAVLAGLVRADRVVLVGFLVDKAANLADRLLTTFAPALFVPGFSFDENRFTYRLKYLAI